MFYWSYSDDIINHKATQTLLVDIIAALYFLISFLEGAFTVGFIRSGNMACDWEMKIISFVTLMQKVVLPFE